MSTTQLQLRFHNEGGVVAWSFRDPADQVRWAGSFHEGERFEEMREFEPTQGEWRLEIDGSQASGSYDVCWLGR